MTRPGTFERVYVAIKDQLRRGLHRPGDRLEPAILSGQLNASVTPVRDALHRLTGERLVEAPRHEGFRVPVMTESTLRHYYAWHRDLVLLALASHRGEPAGDEARELAAAGEPCHRALNSFFIGLARATGNPEHVLALQALIERFEPVQQIEPAVLAAVEAETAEILAAFDAGDRRALRAALARYHRRRLRIVAELLEQFQKA